MQRALYLMFLFMLILVMVKCEPVLFASLYILVEKWLQICNALSLSKANTFILQRSIWGNWLVVAA
jgi:hypothetical protein